MTEQTPHRRAQIINAVATIFEQLQQPPQDSGFPFQFKAVQKQYMHWTSLEKQGALPALMLMMGDKGGKPDADAVGFIDERYPLSVIAVLKEERGGGPIIIDQASDMHYAVESLVNANKTLGVEGVQPEHTKLEDWRVSEESLFPILIIKFRLMVVHRYHATESV